MQLQNYSIQKTVKYTFFLTNKTSYSKFSITEGQFLKSFAYVSPLLSDMMQTNFIITLNKTYSNFTKCTQFQYLRNWD
jgi:hypothetical protein